MKDQAHGLRELVQKQSTTHQEDQKKPEEELARIYSVASGKGGVGKTNFTVNLSLALQAKDRRVGIIDADLGMANIDVVLGLTPQYNLGHVIKGKKKIEEIIVEGPQNLEVIPGTSGAEELANLTDYQLQNLINSWQVLENKYDIILIDIGAGISKSVIDFALAADEIIIISTPEPTSVTDAYGLIKTIVNQQQISEINLVVNRTESDREGKRISNRVTEVVNDFLEIQVNVLGTIPEDKNVIKAVKRQHPFWLEFPNSKAANAIKEIRNQLLDIKEENTSTGVKGFFSKLFGLTDK
ncbi:MinD/ParA family protein [Acetohalobium arabaticum]|uniref:Cobyrinic acid ac-diamide synthase n=1 Tax=Acetohalobium arabaticum (strain ATCC 49924 / DSM 5501 / Z-7288) TaxID=574087 RepID=D9QRI7_ACEAZ|nr:MinD/ParA family protein [Acetohalobium arabaticum]ADL13128.1 Cobyrinic acid ac-diamide synthase [Acetohalobium arabaticum DSM 5501]